MIHTTAPMRVLVAIDAVDGRKGIDSPVRVYQEKLSEIPSLAAYSFSEAAEERRSVCAVMTGKAGVI
jgi:hypothetical protein